MADIDDLLSETPDPPPLPFSIPLGSSSFDPPPTIQGSLTEQQLEEPLLTFDLTELANAFHATNYSAATLIRDLIRLSRDPDPKIQLAAIKELRRHIRESAQLSGRIQQATIKTKGTSRDGQELSGSLQTRRILRTPPLPLPSPISPSGSGPDGSGTPGGSSEAPAPGGGTSFLRPRAPGS